MTRLLTNAPAPCLTRGGALFLEHALGLLFDQARRAHPSDPFAEPFEVGAARASAVLQLALGQISELGAAERTALADALRVAADLALAARLDPRWERLGLVGDPVQELRELRATIVNPAARADFGQILAA